MFTETFAEAWTLRSGEAPGFEVPEVARFLAHRSVRRFASREVSEETASALVAAAQSAATSSNLQLWSVVSVQDPARREEMARLCGDQAQIRHAGLFFAFLADHHRMRTVAQAAGEEALGLGYAEFYTMAVIDAALAAERMVCAAEALGLGVCYIGGLRNDAQGVKEFLRLPEGCFGVFGLCVGWPEEPVTAQIKPRLGQDAVWFREEYDPAPDATEYDARMAAFYKTEGMRGEATWSMRSGRRVGLGRMTGRETLKGWLEEQGFNLK
jgi:nitroreductase